MTQMNADQKNQSRPVALITGASSGSGLDLATLFAQGGHDGVLGARNEEALARRGGLRNRG